MGEALDYVGQKQKVQAQFATAARLDLSQADKRELERAREPPWLNSRIPRSSGRFLPPWSWRAR
jgi:hypothetical protein